MSEKEVKEEYKKIFITLIEEAGEETGNDSYKNIESTIERESKVVSIFRGGEQFDPVEDDAISLTEYIMVLVFYLLADVHGKSLNNKSTDDLVLLIDDLYERYLKKNTRGFCIRFGLPIITSLTENIDGISFNVG